MKPTEVQTNRTRPCWWRKTKVVVSSQNSKVRDRVRGVLLAQKKALCTRAWRGNLPGRTCRERVTAAARGGNGSAVYLFQSIE